MKVILFGGAGKVGHGIKASLQKENSFEVLAPKRSQINLLDYIELKEFISFQKPDVVIHASEYTTSRNSSLFQSNEIYLNNIMQVKFLLDASTNVDKLIHLSSASIYQNYPISVIYESDYKLIDFYPPHEAYAKSKAFGSNEVFNYFELKQSWCSLILPHVIHSNNRRVLGNESFFNWLGNLILNHNMTPEDFRILNKLDMWSLRQFVHSEDVGRFITSLIRGDFHGGVIHLPNLPKINLFDFFLNFTICSMMKIHLNTKCRTACS
jgi:dTDP-4-dehydrorhamnose reductase